MDHARLGRTDLTVSVASLGAGGASRLGQNHGASFEDSVRVVRAAIDAGVSSIDTARGYRTEPIVGAAIAGHREEVVISTKNAIHENPLVPSSPVVTGETFAEGVHQSLSDLRTDYVDVLHVHGLRLDHYTYFEDEILPVMVRLRDEGKVRFLGISEAFGSDAGHALLDRAIDDDYADVLMVGINVVNHSALADALPRAKAKDVGIQCMYAVRGKLASAERARQVVEAAVAAGEVEPAEVDLADPLGFLVGPGLAASATEACYRFVRHAAGVDTVLTGTGSTEHLTENVASINGPPLPGAALSQIERVFGRVRSVTGD